MYTLPQEIDAWYVIPALRREIALCLMREYRISYERIGKTLGVSKAAVSQYIKRKRAARIRLHPKVMVEVERACVRVAKGKRAAVAEIARILGLIHAKSWHCELCGSMIDGQYHDCKEIAYPLIA